MSATPQTGDVLATLRGDGSRRWLRPKESHGRYLTRRRIIGYTLIVVFALLPFVRISGRPGLLIDIPNRQLQAFGAVYQATDTVLLMLFVLGSLLSVFLVTAIAGRAWCGYACPQTVYLELIYRPIERLIEGKGYRSGRVGGAAVAAKLVVFALISLILGNIFVAYFVGSDALMHWMRGSPMAAPVPFFAMLATSVLVFADFAWFREQMCSVACPYARLQSALVDPDSLVVAYDEARGEPRGKPRARNGSLGGDCVDCNACVATCPAGIDIRKGLQLECIACAQCADACDIVMVKLGKPKGLVGYQRARHNRLLMRPRVWIYSGVLLTIFTAFVVLSRRDRSLGATVLATSGTPFVVLPDGRIGNPLRLKLESHASAQRTIRIAIVGSGRELIAPENPVHLAAGESRTVNLVVASPADSFHDGGARIELELDEPGVAPRHEAAVLVGPFSRGSR